jgi:hypothetical protein
VFVGSSGYCRNYGICRRRSTKKDQLGKLKIAFSIMNGEKPYMAAPADHTSLIPVVDAAKKAGIVVAGPSRLKMPTPMSLSTTIIRLSVDEYVQRVLKGLVRILAVSLDRYVQGRKNHIKS